MNFLPNEPGYQPRVLLLGGTSEIGLAILAALGLPADAEVILAGRDEQQLAAAGKELPAKVRTVPYDAVETEGHQAFVDGVFDGGHVDLVVSAAGVLVLQADLERDVRRAAAMIETNFTGHVSTLLAVANRMRAQGRGTIVVLSSVAAVRPRKANPDGPHLPLASSQGSGLSTIPPTRAGTVDSGAVRVLVAEDDEGLGRVLARGLREQGYVVDLVPDGETAASYLRFYQYEVAVLDWRMPRLSGLDLVRRLRRAGTPTPVLMLTARDTPMDRIAGLDAGADDYLVKPFDFGELLARLRALQRRPPVSRSPRMVIGELEFDPATREVTVCGQRPALTGIELGILEILMRRSPGVADRRSIAQHVWDNEADAFGSNTIDVHLARLRSKLAGGGVRIETVRGVGYRIIPA